MGFILNIMVEIQQEFKIKQQNVEKDELDVKVILVGDGKTGKSSFVSLYAETIGQEITKE